MSVTQRDLFAANECFQEKESKSVQENSVFLPDRPKATGPLEKGFQKNPSRRATFYFLGVAVNLLRVDLRHLSNKHGARRHLHSSSHLWGAPGRPWALCPRVPCTPHQGQPCDLWNRAEAMALPRSGRERHCGCHLLHPARNGGLLPAAT